MIKPRDASNGTVSSETNGTLRLSDFDYELPPERIASEPSRPRDQSRLLIVDRKNDSWTDTNFASLAMHLEPSDVIVLNNTRVIKARLYGTLERTHRKIEILFVSPVDSECWQALIRPGRRLRPGDQITVGHRESLKAVRRLDDGLWVLRLDGSGGRSVLELLEAEGQIPLPPYIQRPVRPSDSTDYQTVYSSHPGAVAAPTAGLHFSEQVLASLRTRGIETLELTLHVGPGTFVPVRTDDPTQHVLSPEVYAISQETATALNRARQEERRIIAVGTTTTRALEFALLRNGAFRAERGRTDLFIQPGFQFRAIDGLLTNFHLPRSTLLLLVSAFASRQLVLDAYRHAIAAGYRFYSYGDCTLFL